MNITILFISQDPPVEENFLAEDGFDLRFFSDTEQAADFAALGHVDLAVIDRCSLDDGGLFVLQKLRGKFAFPIIILVEAASEAERIAALMSGADDVLQKPFSTRELAAHIHSLLRRSARNAEPDLPPAPSKAEEDHGLSEIEIDGLRINSLTHKCFLDGREIKLTPLEFSILWYLCARRGRVVPGEELFEAVWGEKYLDSAGTVMPHIARLRKKLCEPPRSPKYLKTVWGVGYTVE